MGLVNGQSQVLSESGIEQAQYIAAKFSFKPYVSSREERPVYQSALLGPCCCDRCYHQSYCRLSGKECKAFRHFVADGKWIDKHLGVDLR